ncbi:hypothetical protein D3C77_374960 [compost metagenome]
MRLEALQQFPAHTAGWGIREDDTRLGFQRSQLVVQGVIFLVAYQRLIQGVVMIVVLI